MGGELPPKHTCWWPTCSASVLSCCCCCCCCCSSRRPLSSGARPSPFRRGPWWWGATRWCGCSCRAAAGSSPEWVDLRGGPGDDMAPSCCAGA